MTHYCFLLLPLPLLGSFELPLLVVPAVLLPLQPLVLVILVAVIPVEDKTIVTSLVLLLHLLLLTHAKNKRLVYTKE